MDARILVAEDNREISDFLRHILQGENYQVLWTVDGEEALKKAREESPDLVLLDATLPKIHGFEVCQRLRQDPATCLLPIIMVTSLTAAKDRITGIKLGADEYVAKPFIPAELLARIERLLQRTRQNQAANPLTGLAGWGALRQWIQRRLETANPFIIGFGDANGMGHFNDLYGYDRGDQAIRLMGAVWRSALSELGGAEDAVVHMDAEKFAFGSDAPRGEVLAARVLENMESLMPMQYDEESRKRGHLFLHDGQGREIREPFLSFAVGLAEIKPGHCQHPAQVLDQARHAWKEAKARGGNQMVKV